MSKPSFLGKFGSASTDVLVSSQMSYHHVKRRHDIGSRIEKDHRLATRKRVEHRVLFSDDSGV